jgi:hypothetical protein
MCLQCRTALFDGEPCDDDVDHEVVSLFDPVQREALVEAAWGPRDVRHSDHRQRLNASRAGALAATISGIGGICLTWLIFPQWGPMHLFGSFLAGVMVYGATTRMMTKAGARFPAGGAVPLLTSGPMGRRGEIAGITHLVSPATGTDCVGYALELRLAGQWGDELMYRDAVCTSFEVQLEGGGVAQVPAGRFRLVGSMRQEIDVDNLELEGYINELDPHRNASHIFDPLRYNVVCEQVLLPGDRVELVSTFEPRVSSGADATLYRDAAPSKLAPIGVPALRLLTPAP